MVRLPRMLLKMLRYARDRLLELRAAAPEAPEELLNSGIGVLTREDDSIILTPESVPKRFDSTQKDEYTAERTPAVTKEGDLGMNHGLGGHSEKEKEVEIICRKDVNSELQGILSKLEVSQSYALLARQVRQEGIPSEETLRGVISLIFENAATHPAQCAMYAHLCVLLSKLELPEFPGDKTVTFQSVLLTTCQEEFEMLTKPEQAVERDAEKEKRIKFRKLGIIKLIGELYNKKLLPENVVHKCIQELLGPDHPKAIPTEENVEVLCHFLKTVGKQLEVSTKSKMAFDTYFARLRVLGESRTLPSRIWNLVRNVFDLRSKKWVCPQEEVKAKKINKIRAKAKAGQRPETTMALRKPERPAASPKLLPAGSSGNGRGMSVTPLSILGMPGMPGMSGGGASVQLVDERRIRKASVDKKALLSVPVTSDLAKGMKSGVSRAAAMPKPIARDHFGVRTNKDDFNLRDLSHRVQMSNN